MSFNGGKGGAGVAQWIINQMPPHRVYIEPFLGGGAVMRLKRPSPASIGIERDARSATRFSARVPGLVVVNGDGISTLENFEWRGGELVYADPPYLFGVRESTRRIYRYELRDFDHVRLLGVLRSLPCMVIVSGYWSELYASQLSAWRTASFNTVKRSGAPATEWLWMNFSAPERLHDYRFLGRDFRERERIRRRVRRWCRRLELMPVLEKNAVLSSIGVGGDGGP